MLPTCKRKSSKGQLSSEIKKIVLVNFYECPVQYLPKTVNNQCQNVYNVLLFNLQNNSGLGTWKSQAGQVEKAVEYAIKVTA